MSAPQPRFRATRSWGSWPEGWEVCDVTAVAVDRDDNVVVFRRGAHPVAILDPGGAVQASFGDGEFANPHGLSLAPDGTILCTDSGGHVVVRFSPEGELLERLERRAEAAAYGEADPLRAWTVTQAGPPFNYPTAAVEDAAGRVYVTDGYGNARVHRFARGGALEASWGQPGSAPGSFSIPHGIAVGPDGLLYVADRLNGRIQIIDADGGYRGEWPAHLPNDLCFDADGNAYVAELGGTVTWAEQDVLRWPPARVTVRDPQGRVLAELTEPDPAGTGSYFAPHGVAVDAAGTVYVAEVPFTYSQGRAPAGTSVLRRYERVR